MAVPLQSQYRDMGGHRPAAESRLVRTYTVRHGSEILYMLKEVGNTVDTLARGGYGELEPR